MTSMEMATYGFDGLRSRPDPAKDNSTSVANPTEVYNRLGRIPKHVQILQLIYFQILAWIAESMCCNLFLRTQTPEWRGKAHPLEVI